VLDLLAGRALTLEELCQRTGSPARDVALAAARLRLDQLVVVSDGLYRPSGGALRRPPR
jgi:hypothetical protein